MLRFAEELLILTIDAEHREPVMIPDFTFGCALAGATLMDLALENRIDTDTKALYVIDPTPVGDSLLDPVLAEIVQESKTLPPGSWVTRIARRGDDLRGLALDRLVAANILEADDGGVFSLSRWVNRSRSYPNVDGEAAQEIQSRMLSVLMSNEIPSPRDSVIISLADACGVFRRILDDSEYQEVKERLELIVGLELIPQSVTEAVRSVNWAESQFLQRVPRKRGTWPRASGWLPVVGHAFKLIGNLNAFCAEQYVEHGPVFEVSALGKTHVVMAGPEVNEFVNRRGRFHLRNWETWRGFNHYFGAANVLIGLDGASHRRLRKTKSRGYSRKFILEQLPEVVAVVERELAGLPSDRPLSVLKIMQRVMAEQITLLAAGVSCRNYIDDMVVINEAMHLVLVMKLYPKFMMRMPRVKRARRRLELLMDRVLAAHESKPDTGASRDLIDDLLQLHRSAPDSMPETDLFINAMGPFMVGLDTVAPTTSFALYALLKRPDLLERVRAEADDLFAAGDPTAEGIQGMTATRGVVMETLRVYPIATALPRTVMNSFDFAGYHIPAGTRLLIPINVAHLLSEFFPNPEVFDIDRYSPARREHVRRGVFVPFGVGHHSCLGRGFAEVQMALTLATLLHRVEIALEPSGYRLKTRYFPAPRPDGKFKIRLRQRQ